MPAQGGGEAQKRLMELEAQVEMLKEKATAAGMLIHRHHGLLWPSGSMR